MIFSEYINSIKDVPVSEHLKFAQAILWLDPSHLPLGAVTLENETMPVIKIPERAVNRFGNSVPVITITPELFKDREHVTDIILPPSIDRLPSGAFSGCRNLKNITIPKKIKSIRQNTFDGCSDLENIFYEGSAEEWDKISIVHQQYEVDFGDVFSGTPVQQIVSERLLHIPGNDAIFSANIHFRCNLSEIYRLESLIPQADRDITELIRTV